MVPLDPVIPRNDPGNLGSLTSDYKCKAGV